MERRLRWAAVDTSTGKKNTTMRTTILTLSILLTHLAACSGKSADASGSASGSAAPAGDKGGAKTADKPSSIEVKIAKMGLKGTAAGESVEPLTTDADPIYMMTFSKFSVQLRPASDITPKTPKDVEDESKMFDKNRNFKSEKLADGWMTTFEHTGGAGDFYNLTVRRDIGGKAYICTTGADNDEMRKKALDFCKSLATL